MRPSIVHRPNAHEIFGYDFMVDTFLNVWLIEVNSSPSMEYSTKVTEKIVSEALSFIPELAMEGGGRDTVGKFRKIYQEE